MSVIVVYDPADPQVANKVTEFNPSAHGPAYASEPNKLENPDIGTLWTASGGFTVPLKHWKYDGAGDIIEMSSGEKAIIDKTYESSKNASSETESSTASDQYQEKLTMSFDCDAGTYCLAWCAEVSSNGSKVVVLFRIQVDNTDTVCEVKVMPDAATFDGYGPVNGFINIPLTQGVHTIDMDYASGTDATVVKIRRARLEIK